ncbi:MAG: hypothetical protein IJM38_00155 [Ruminococcus sp.]|nr:hypothetical protein [Ruminococcus sp.]
MHIHLSDKVKFVIVTFVIAFIVVMSLFIWKPHIVKSKNKYLRTFFVFAIAFIPGVLAASVCAKTITTVWDKFFTSEVEEIVIEEETEEKENDKII